VALYIVHYKYDHQLFRRYTRNALKRRITECLFVDDGALLVLKRSRAVNAASKWVRTLVAEEQTNGDRQIS